MRLEGLAVGSVLFAVLALCGCGAGQQPASELPAISLPSEVTPAACPVLTPAQMAAGDEAASTGEFVPWVDYQERFGSFAWSVQTAYPEEFATARVEGNCGRGTIGFKGAVPAELVAQGPDVEGVTFVADLGFNQEESAELARRALDAAQAELGNVSMGGGFDWEERTVDVTYGPNADGVALSVEAMEELAAKNGSSALLPEGL